MDQQEDNGMGTSKALDGCYHFNRKVLLNFPNVRI